MKSLKATLNTPPEPGFDEASLADLSMPDMKAPFGSNEPSRRFSLTRWPSNTRMRPLFRNTIEEG